MTKIITKVLLATTVLAGAGSAYATGTTPLFKQAPAYDITQYLSDSLSKNRQFVRYDDDDDSDSDFDEDFDDYTEKQVKAIAPKQIVHATAGAKSPKKVVKKMEKKNLGTKFSNLSNLFSANKRNEAKKKVNASAAVKAKAKKPAVEVSKMLLEANAKVPKMPSIPKAPEAPAIKKAPEAVVKKGLVNAGLLGQIQQNKKSSLKKINTSVVREKSINVEQRQPKKVVEVSNDDDWDTDNLVKQPTIKKNFSFEGSVLKNFMKPAEKKDDIKKTPAKKAVEQKPKAKIVVEKEKALVKVPAQKKPEMKGADNFLKNKAAEIKAEAKVMGASSSIKDRAKAYLKNASKDSSKEKIAVSGGSIKDRQKALAKNNSSGNSDIQKELAALRSNGSNKSSIANKLSGLLEAKKHKQSKKSKFKSKKLSNNKGNALGGLFGGGRSAKALEMMKRSRNMSQGQPATKAPTSKKAKISDLKSKLAALKVKADSIHTTTAKTLSSNYIPSAPKINLGAQINSSTKIAAQAKKAPMSLLDSIRAGKTLKKTKKNTKNAPRAASMIEKILAKREAMNISGFSIEDKLAKNKLDKTSKREAEQAKIDVMTAKERKEYLSKRNDIISRKKITTVKDKEGNNAVVLSLEEMKAKRAAEKSAKLAAMTPEQVSTKLAKRKRIEAEIAQEMRAREAVIKSKKNATKSKNASQILKSEKSEDEQIMELLAAIAQYESELSESKTVLSEINEEILTEAVVASLTEYEVEQVRRELEQTDKEKEKAKQKEEALVQTEAQATELANATTAAQAAENAISNTQNISNISAEITATAMKSIMSRLASTSFAGIAAGDEEEATIEKGLWISGLYSSSKQGTIGKNSGYTSQGQGFTIGFDAEVKEDIKIGVAYGKVISKYKHKAKNAGTSNMNVDVVSLYSQATFGNILTDVILSAMKSVVNNKHALGSGKLKSSGYGSQASVGYKAKISDRLTLVPNASVRYNLYSSKAYKETGANNYSVAMKAKTASTLGVKAGVKLLMPIKKSLLTTITPYLSADIGHASTIKGDKVTIIDIKYFDSSLSETIRNKKKSEISYNIGGGVTAQHNNIQLQVNYDCTLKKKYQNHQGSIRLRLEF